MEGCFYLFICLSVIQPYLLCCPLDPGWIIRLQKKSCASLVLLLSFVDVTLRGGGQKNNNHLLKCLLVQSEMISIQS